MNQELVERVARAIYKEFANNHDLIEDRLDCICDAVADSYRRGASAAITEITKAYVEWSGK